MVERHARVALLRKRLPGPMPVRRISAAASASGLAPRGRPKGLHPRAERLGASSAAAPAMAGGGPVLTASGIEPRPGCAPDRSIPQHRRHAFPLPSEEGFESRPILPSSMVSSARRLSKAQLVAKALRAIHHPPQGRSARPKRRPATALEGQKIQHIPLFLRYRRLAQPRPGPSCRGRKARLGKLEGIGQALHIGVGRGRIHPRGEGQGRQEPGAKVFMRPGILIAPRAPAARPPHPRRLPRFAAPHPGAAEGLRIGATTAMASDASFSASPGTWHRAR